MDSSDECAQCRKETGEDIVGCDKCDKWLHYTCAGLTAEQVSRVINFFCKTCTNRQCFTTWRRVAATSAQKTMKRRLYHEVEAIHNHRTRGSQREFLIEWKGCLAPRARVNVRTWEPEEYLDGAIDLLQLYCMEKEIPLSEIEGLQGAGPSSEQQSVQNWTTMSTLLAKFEQVRRQTKNSSTLLASEWFQFGDQDQLYFLHHQQHCFVLLHIVSRRLAYIADGANIFRTDQQVAGEIKALLNIRLVPLEYTQQLGNDHCASSAILIGLELLKMHSRGIRFQKLITSKCLRAQVVKYLHRYESSTVAQTPLRQRRETLTCSFCDKTYKSTQASALRMHITRAHRQ